MTATLPIFKKYNGNPTSYTDEYRAFLMADGRTPASERIKEYNGTLNIYTIQFDTEQDKLLWLLKWSC